MKTTVRRGAAVAVAFHTTAAALSKSMVGVSDDHSLEIGDRREVGRWVENANVLGK